MLGVEAGVRHARKHLAAYAGIRIKEGETLSPKEREILVTTHCEKIVISLLEKLFHPSELRSAA